MRVGRRVAAAWKERGTRVLAYLGIIGFLIGLGLVVGAIAFYLRFVEGQGFRPLLYLVILLETVGFLLLGVGLMAEMVAQLHHEVDTLRRRLK